MQVIIKQHLDHVHSVGFQNKKLQEEQQLDLKESIIITYQEKYFGKFKEEKYFGI